MKRKLSDTVIESLIIKGITADKKYLTMLMNSFEPQYFDNPVYKDIYKCTVDHYKQNLTLPDDFIINDIVDCGDTLSTVKDIDFDLDKNFDFLLKETNFYLKEKAIKQSILDSVDIVDSNENINEIKTIVEKALAKDLIIDLGTDYWDTLIPRLKNVLLDNENKMPFYFPILDEFTNGGPTPYSLSLFLSRIHGFKCVGKNTIITIRNKKTKEIYDTRIEDFFKCFINMDEHKTKGEVMLNLEGMIKKYGEKDGTERYNTWKRNVGESSKNRNTLPYFIKKYGEKDGTERYNIYIKRQKFSQSLEGMIKKYGEKEGTKKWNKRIINHKNANSLEGLIKKYGEEEGNRRREEHTMKWQNTLNSKSDEEKKTINDKKKQTLSNMIKRHGEEDGVIRYKSMLTKRFDNKSYTISKPERELFDSLSIKLDGHLIEKQKWISNKYAVDIMIDNKICIEFYGDYWHCNPKIFESTYYHSLIDMVASEKWEHDKKRIEYIQKCGYKTYILWENTWNDDKNKALNDIIKFIKENVC